MGKKKENGEKSVVLYVCRPTEKPGKNKPVKQTIRLITHEVLCMSICIYTLGHIYIYMHIYIYTHTLIHTQMPAMECAQL